MPAHSVSYSEFRQGRNLSDATAADRTPRMKGGVSSTRGYRPGRQVLPAPADAGSTTAIDVALRQPLGMVMEFWSRAHAQASRMPARSGACSRQAPAQD